MGCHQEEETRGRVQKSTSQWALRISSATVWLSRTSSQVSLGSCGEGRGALYRLWNSASDRMDSQMFSCFR